MKTAIKYLYFVACFMLLISSTALAYIDPSVMTYTIQIVAGIAVAVGAVVGVYWRRAKKKVQEKLGIDENSKKEVEEVRAARAQQQQQMQAAETMLAGAGALGSNLGKAPEPGSPLETIMSGGGV